MLFLFCGIPPICDRCCESDAKAGIDLPTYGHRTLCEGCLQLVIERGLEAGQKGDSQISESA